MTTLRTILLIARGRVLVLAAALMCMGSPNGALAQGTLDPPYILTTQGTSALMSTNMALDLPGTSLSPVLVFTFGFATDEAQSPGGFLDSFTITLVGTEGQTAVYSVVDAGGLVLGPVTPGTIPLDPGTIEVTSVPFPTSLPLLAWQEAYQMAAPVPSALSGSRVTVYFDLFDNGNAFNSLAWAHDVQVVPEPHTNALLLLSLTVWLARTRRNEH